MTKRNFQENGQKPKIKVVFNRISKTCIKAYPRNFKCVLKFISNHTEILRDIAIFKINLFVLTKTHRN